MHKASSEADASPAAGATQAEDPTAEGPARWGGHRGATGPQAATAAHPLGSALNGEESLSPTPGREGTGRQHHQGGRVST